jgi:Ca2+-binding RTX toxin-like protein
LANTLTGDAAANILNGGAGNDSLVGGAGNDTYIVDSSSDVINEATTSTSEIDAVQASVSWTLGANLENLTLTGTAANGTGNALANTLTGDAAANILNGGAGNDILVGGAGNDNLTGGVGSDTFLFNIAANTLINKDTITDFVSGTDTLQFNHSIFTSLAVGTGTTLAANQFVSSTTATSATTSTTHLIYNSISGVLYYDADATGSGAAVQIALIGTATHPALVYTDIGIVL